MLFVTANNDRALLDELTETLLSVYRGSMVFQHTNPMRALEDVLSNDVDAVFLEARMQDVSGFELLRLLRQRQPDLPVYILSETEMHRSMALRERASGFLLRPVNARDLARMLQAGGIAVERQPSALGNR